MHKWNWSLVYGPFVPSAQQQTDQAYYTGQVACIEHINQFQLTQTIRYDTIEEFNVDSKAEYSALSSTRSRKKKLKQTTPVPL